MIHGHDTALRLARASDEAYWTSHPRGSVTIGNAQCTAHITTDHECKIIAFQGTNDGVDWVSNADRRYMKHGLGRIHNGFMASLAPWFEDLMAEAEDTPGQLWITGHSRGGAQALLLAAVCVGAGIPVAGVYTFGSPRVGDTAFAHWCDKNIPGHHRYVYQSDIVTRIPRVGFTHCGKLHWHDGREWRQHMPLHSRLGAWLFFRKWPIFGDPVGDHGMANYIGALT